MEHTYIITVQPFGVIWEKISQECYKDLKKAQEFILNRADNPVMVSDFKFKSKCNMYRIYELSVEE